MLYLFDIVLLLFIRTLQIHIHILTYYIPKLLFAFIIWLSLHLPGFMADHKEGGWVRVRLRRGAAQVQVTRHPPLA